MKNIWSGQEFESMLEEMKKVEWFQPNFKLDDYRKMIDLLDEAIDDLHKSNIEQTIHLEYVKRELIKKLDDKTLQSSESVIEGSIHSSMVLNDVLLIHMDHLLPMINDKNLKDKFFFNELRNFYVPALSQAIMNQNPNFEDHRVFVAIVQYYPKRIIRDIDNHFIKFIFNSLRYSGLISDDTYENVFYMMIGTLAEKANGGTGYTEIYITESKNMKKVISHLPLDHFLQTK